VANPKATTKADPTAAEYDTNKVWLLIGLEALRFCKKHKK
jgi:hypothetical protein